MSSDVETVALQERPKSDIAYTPVEVAWACLHLLDQRIAPGDVIWEPHAGAGSWVQAAAMLPVPDLRLYASDIDPDAPCLRRGWPWWSRQHDALKGSPVDRPVDWIVGNPPNSTFDAQLKASMDVARLS